jgi:hypothetical protein
MLKNSPITIKAQLGLSKKQARLVLERANAVLAGLYSDPDDFGKPPIDQGVFKSNVDSLSTKITASLDGGKQAIADRDHQTAVVIKMMHQLAHHAEDNCKDDMATFLKSGFSAVSTVKAKKQPLSQFIRNIVQGPLSGQVLVTVVAVAGASSYELRWAPLGSGGTPASWLSQIVAKARPASPVTGLTPGTTYAFQVRSLVKGVYSDWSDSVTRIAM